MRRSSLAMSGAPILLLLLGWSHFVAAVIYKAAFVEARSVSGTSNANTLQLNAAESVRLAQQASHNGANVIVFPEYGLTGWAGSTPNQRAAYAAQVEEIPEPNGDIPCNNSGRYSSAPTIVTLSCGAMANHIIIVAGTGDKINCNNAQHPGCGQSADGKLQFNTAIAFDSDGSFVAKHHKQNLWGEEAYVDVPQDCKQTNFSSKIGVTFALIVCADAIHDFPEQDMVRDGIKNFLTPIAWDNTMAQMQAMSWYQAWSYRDCINVIATNYGGQFGPPYTGSGIFSCGKVKASYYDPNGQKVIVYAQLDSDSSVESTTANLQLSPPANIGSAPFGWQFAPLSTGMVCSGTVCCKASTPLGGTAGYAIAALDGHDSGCGYKTHGQTCSRPSLNWKGEVCAIFACANPGGGCLTYQTPTGSLRSVTLDMTVNTGTVVFPHLLAYNGSAQEQVLLEPGSGFMFRQTVSASQLQVSSTNNLALTVVEMYGRPYVNESLQYQCPATTSTTTTTLHTSTSAVFLTSQSTSAALQSTSAAMGFSSIDGMLVACVIMWALIVAIFGQ